MCRSFDPHSHVISDTIHIGCLLYYGIGGGEFDLNSIVINWICSRAVFTT